MGSSSSSPKHPAFMLAEGLSSDEGENSIDEFFTKRNGLIRPDIAYMWKLKGLTHAFDWVDRDELHIYSKERRKSLKKKKLADEELARLAAIAQAAAQDSVTEASTDKNGSEVEPEADGEATSSKSKNDDLEDMYKKEREHYKHHRQHNQDPHQKMSVVRSTTIDTPSSTTSSSSSSPSPERKGETDAEVKKSKSSSSSASSLTSEEVRKKKENKLLMKSLKLRPPPRRPSHDLLQPPQLEYPRQVSDTELNRSPSKRQVGVSKSLIALPFTRTKAKDTGDSDTDKKPKKPRKKKLKHKGRRKNAQQKRKARSGSRGRGSWLAKVKHGKLVEEGTGAEDVTTEDETTQAKLPEPGSAPSRVPDNQTGSEVGGGRSLIYQFKKWLGVRNVADKWKQKPDFPSYAHRKPEPSKAGQEGKHVEETKDESSGPEPDGYDTDVTQTSDDRMGRAAHKHKKKKVLKKKRKRSSTPSTKKPDPNKNHPSFSQGQVFARAEFEERNTRILQHLAQNY